MSRITDQRESRALKFLVKHREVSPSQLGQAAVDGEVKTMRPDGRLKLGFSIGQRFVKRGIARLSRENKFLWMPPKK